MPEQATEPRYRWVIVTAAAVMLAVTMGQLVSGLSVFFLPLEREFGWARGDIALINTAGLVGLAIGGILLGRAADRWGVRWICLAGGAVLGLCILAAAQAASVPACPPPITITSYRSGNESFSRSSTSVGP